MSEPLVSVICLCHNQKSFVAQAIRSVWSQTYHNLELIIVDDGSKDGSKEEIRATLGESNVTFIDIDEGEGNCKAFNKGFRASNGDYLIDLAADDLLLPTRIELGVQEFQNHPNNFGVHFCDAFIINEKGDSISTHYLRNSDGELINEIPDGDLYMNLIKRYFICPPTMMFKRNVLEELGGYDEELSYEDFDFWIRSSREYQYIFNKAPLIKKRMVTNSHSSSQSKFFNAHQTTTFRVCEKIYALNSIKKEDEALIERINYEIKQCIKTLNLKLIPNYWKLKQACQRRLSSASNIDK